MLLYKAMSRVKHICLGPFCHTFLQRSELLKLFWVTARIDSMSIHMAIHFASREKGQQKGLAQIFGIYRLTGSGHASAFLLCRAWVHIQVTYTG